MSKNKAQVNEGVLDDMDEDGWMAKSQLYQAAKYAIELHKMIQDTDNLEPWVQSKISKAADYLSSIKHYMEYESVNSYPGEATDEAPVEIEQEPMVAPIEVDEDEVVHEAFEKDEVMAIMKKHPQDVARMNHEGDMNTASGLYTALYRYYLDSGEMPYGTAKARDGDPVEFIMDRLDDLDMLESTQDKLRNQFTVRTFDEGLNDALPYVNALVKEMKAIREADEFTKQTLDSLVATIDKMDSVKLRKGIDVKSDPENPMNFSSFGNMPKENQIATVLEYLGNSIEFSKSQDQLVTLLTRMSDEMERVKDKPMMVKVIGAIKTLMPKLTTTASEGTDIKKVSVGNYMERKLSNYEFDKLFG